MVPVPDVMASVTEPTYPVITFPYGSVISTDGCVVKAAPGVAPPGCIMKTKVVATFIAEVVVVKALQPAISDTGSIRVSVRRTSDAFFMSTSNNNPRDFIPFFGISIFSIAVTRGWHLHFSSRAVW